MKKSMDDERQEEDIYYFKSYNIRAVPSKKQLRNIVIEILEKCVSSIPNENQINELETLIKNYMSNKLGYNLLVEDKS